jgi:2',3'-cyclic-nucleotide 2'-phosphodiesterase (5'-nucleotidase family)
MAGQALGGGRSNINVDHRAEDMNCNVRDNETDSSRLKQHQPKNSNSPLKTYKCYAINSDSLLKGKGDQSFLWIDSFRNLQNQIIQKPLLWSARVITKSMPESELSNLLADILLFESRKIWGAVDVAMLNPGGIRAGFPADTLRLLHIMEVLPFPNHLDKITLTGTELMQLLDHWAAKGGIALSGLRMTIKDGKSAGVMVGDVSLDLNRSYNIALPDYLVNGGDGCTFLVGSTVERGAFRITDLVTRHLEEMGLRGEPLKTQTDGRIRIQ